MPPRIAIIGAGPSGLAALKTLRQAGLTDTTVFERAGQLGGNWAYTALAGHPSVMATTHLISSRRLSGFSDFPMPEHLPDYPSHRQVLAFFESYAHHFGLLERIRFNAVVATAVPRAGGGWELTLEGGDIERVDHLVVASGHHWDPRMPEYPGTFDGTFLHAHDCRTVDRFRDQRVLVIGGGNSACDVAVEAGRVARHVGLSVRRGYYIIPKFFFGTPTDVMNRRMLWLPRPIRARIQRLTWLILTGGMARYGLPDPAHGILDAHPTISSDLLESLRHGRVLPYPDVARFEGRTVHFADGRAEEFDSVVAATGYRISFPFLDPALVDFREGPVPLFLRVFPPRIPGLAFIGLIQPQGCIWPLAELQAGVVAAVILGRRRLPDDLERRAHAEATRIARRYTGAARHTIEVDFHEYGAILRRWQP